MADDELIALFVQERSDIDSVPYAHEDEDAAVIAAMLGGAA